MSKKEFSTAAVTDFLSGIEESREAEEIKKRGAVYSEAIATANKEDSTDTAEPEKKKRKEITRDIRVSFVMTEQLREDIRTLAYLSGVTTSEIMHRILSQYADLHREDINRCRR